MTNAQLVLYSAVMVSIVTSASLAQERRISRKDLPASVQETIKQQSQGAAIRGFSEEKQRGETFYEAELTVNGHSKDILMNGKGEIVEVEEQQQIGSLPEAVRKGLQAKAAAGKLIKVESITKRGKVVAYEAQVLDHGKKSEVQVGPDGKALGHEE